MSRPGSADVVLAVDLGTGGPKVALVDLDGTVRDHEHGRTEPTVGADGSAVQDPGAWWSALVRGTRTMLERGAVAPERVCAVAVTGQWGSTVPVDATGEPVGDCVLWLDRRGRALAEATLGGRITVEGFTPRKILTWIRRTGGAPSTDGADPLGQRLLIEHEHPDVYARTATFLEPLDWLNARFTGRIAASQSSMVLSWLTDNRRLGVTEYDPTLVRMAAVDPDRLPPLVPVHEPMGSVRAEVASELGIPSGIPVTTALPDLLATPLGSGAVADHAGHLSISTSAWIGCHTDSQTTSIAKQMATIPAALPGRYVLANNHETAGLCLEWLRSRVLLADDGLTAGATASFDDLTALAATAAPGSGGVLFAPWLNGERSPVADADLRGSFLNLSMATTRADLVRALLEGVAHNARWLLEASEGVLGRPMRGLRIVGGGAISDRWCQIHADVIGRPLERPAAPMLAAIRGAALFAGLVLGRLGPEDLAARVPVERTFEPDPDARRVLEDAYAVFVDLYRSQRRLYRRLNRARPPTP